MNFLKSIARVQRAANRIYWIPVLLLEVTDRCNSRCVMCEVWSRGENKDLDGRSAERLVLSLKKRGLRFVLITGGEPLLRPDIFEMCERLSRHGVKLVLSTNGLLLEKFERDVADHFDLVIVSLDSHDSRGYESVRGLDGFHEVTEGIRFLKRHGGTVMLSHTLQKENLQGLADFIAFSKTLNVDRVSVRPVDAFSRAFGREEWRPGLVEDLIPSEAEIGRLSELIDKIGRNYRQDIRNGFLRPNIKGFRMIRDYFLACRGGGDFPGRKCDMPFISLTMEADGDVKPCFFLEAFADIHEIEKSGIEPIIKSQRLAEIRRRYKEGRIPECRRCVQPYAADF